MCASMIALYLQTYCICRLLSTTHNYRSVPCVGKIGMIRVDLERWVTNRYIIILSCTVLALYWDSMSLVLIQFVGVDLLCCVLIWYDVWSRCTATTSYRRWSRTLTASRSLLSTWNSSVPIDPINELLISRWKTYTWAKGGRRRYWTPASSTIHIMWSCPLVPMVSSRSNRRRTAYGLWWQQ